MNDNSLSMLMHEIDACIMQSPYPEDPIHSLNTLEWLLKLMPDADEVLRIAARGHDIEHADDERRVSASSFSSYDEYKEAHARNSALVLSEIMLDCGMDEQFIEDVGILVANHETGGTPRADVLMHSDVLSFFHVSLPLYLDRKGVDTTRKRMIWSYKKLPFALRKEVGEMEYIDEQMQELVTDLVRNDF